MQYVQELVEAATGHSPKLQTFKTVYRAGQYHKLRYWFWGILGALVLIAFLPWTQNIRARGSVTTLRQEQRPQELNTIIAGRILKWHVKEGDLVKAGDTIVQLAEIKDEYLDPELLQRIREQLSAKKDAVESYQSKVNAADQQIAALIRALDLKISELGNKVAQQKLKIQTDSMEWVAALNDLSIKSEQYRRQQVMYDSGLASLVQLEQRNQARQDAMAKRTSAEIKFNNSKQEMLRLQLELDGERQQYLEKISKADGDRYQTLSQIATAQGELAKLQNQYINYSIRSGQYYIRAPQDGQIVKAAKAGINEIVKEGERIVEIVPTGQQYAVEIYVRPLDLPLISQGQKVRFLFDGFPAIVFSGWPQASYGTFGGKVVAIESSVSSNGMFRVLVSEDENDRPWPRQLKQGSGALGIALLKDVPVWYELWRNINGFPPDYYTPSTQNNTTTNEKKNN